LADYATHVWNPPADTAACPVCWADLPPARDDKRTCSLCGKVVSVTPKPPAPIPPEFIAGLDLGKVSDFTALVIPKRVTDPTTGNVTYKVPVIQRFQLGTPYVAMVDKVNDWLTKPPLDQAILVIDATGVGQAVVEMFRAKPKLANRIVPVTITAGRAVTWHHGSWHVAKVQLASTVQALLSGRQISIPIPSEEAIRRNPSLLQEQEIAQALTEELENFTVKVTTAGNEQLEAWRETDHDDLCLSADSLVLTSRGWIPIPSVTTTDKVLTRQGWKRVLWSGMTSSLSDSIIVDCGDDYSLRCTPRHPILTATRGWVNAEDLAIGEGVVVCPSWKRANGTAGRGDDIRIPPTEAIASTFSGTKGGRSRPSGFTRRYGSRSTGTFLKGFTSTTLTRTLSTMQSKTWSAFQPQSITLAIERPSDFMANQRSSLPISLGYDPAALSPLLPGRYPQRERLQCQSLQSEAGMIGQCSSLSVNSARQNFSRRIPDLSTVRTDACSEIIQPRLFTRASAERAEPSSWQRSASSGFATTAVRRLLANQQSEPVYNLLVEGCPEFFANGILVHNCLALALALWWAEGRSTARVEMLN